MEKTDAGTAVGVDDPYAHVDRCDHLTDEGTCRLALESPDRDPQFATDRRRENYRCPVAGDPDVPGLTGRWDWADCPHFRCRNRARKCVRCGLTEERMAHDESRPLLEEHHLSYADGETTGEGGTTGNGGATGDASDGLGGSGHDRPSGEHSDGGPSHEITVFLCRWCHAKVHDSWARVGDDVSPDPEAVAAREQRRARQQRELGFETAATRQDEG